MPGADLSFRVEASLETLPGKSKRDSADVTPGAESAEEDARPAQPGDDPVAGKNAQIEELTARLRQRDDALAAKEQQVESLITRLKQRDGTLAEREERIVEYLYHLNRINASPWWRLGMRIDNLISAPLRIMNREPKNATAHEYRDSFVALPLAYEIPAMAQIPSVAVLLHAYYVDELAEIQHVLKNIPFPFALYISTDSEQKKELIEQSFFGWRGGTVEVHVFPNRGRDIAPKFVGFRHVHELYEFVLHIHTKKSPHSGALMRWSPFVLECLLGSSEIVAGVFEMFNQCPDLGIVAPRNFAPIRNAMVWGVNFDNCSALARRMGAALKPVSRIDFAAGSMFWARSAALKPLLDLDLTFDSFEEERSLADGTLGHAIERLTFYSCELSGYTWVHAGPEHFLAPFEKAFGVSSRDDFHRILPAIKVDLLGSVG